MNPPQDKNQICKNCGHDKSKHKGVICSVENCGCCIFTPSNKNQNKLNESKKK